MEHFIEGILEGVLELFSGIVRTSPDEMPDISYKDCFVVKYNVKHNIFATVASVLLLIALVAAAVFIDNDVRIMFIILAAGACVLLIYTLWMHSYSCVVTPETLTETKLFSRRKTVFWKDILCVRKIEYADKSDVTIALYNHDGKLVLDVSSDADNAWYILKMAEEKQIEIRSEKNLSIRKMMRL